MSGGRRVTDAGRSRQQRTTALVLACAAAMTVTGCGRGATSSVGASTTAVPTVSATVSATASSAAPSVTAGGDQATAPDPNAPEVNAAGDIPDNQVFVPFTTPDGAVVVSVPQGWARASDGPATVFTDKFNSVRVEDAARPAAADVTSARAEDVPQLQTSVTGFTLGDVHVVRRTAGSAVVITYEADSAPNAVTGRSVRESVERYTLWHNGQEAVLTLSGPKGADNVDPWRIVTNSLRWQA